MSKYKPVIGFEVHLQPKTKSKMFSDVSAEYFGKAPNTHVDPVSLGLPGAMPVPNKKAIEKCILLSLALHCDINKKTKFDRKNYFYPDLPKGYQISQYDLPFGYEGYLEFDIEGDSRRIRITRVHMEEDTGKSIHEKDKTLIDLNKAGVPLIEIVTEPDFQGVEEVDKFAKRLRQIVRYLGISDADMEKGQMRYELNISLKKPEDEGLPNYKVEVKNIASISVLKKVIESEIERQTILLDKGETPVQETRGIRGMSGKTVSQRVKEESDDYRYFPEPDIPEIEVGEEWLNEIRKDLIELPQEKKDRYMSAYALDPDSAEVLVSSKGRYKFFEECVESLKIDKGLFQKYVREISKWILGDVSALMTKSKTRFADLKIKPTDIIELIAAIEAKRITGTIAKKVLGEVFESGKSSEAIIKDSNLEVVTDESAIEKFADEAIAANQKVVADIEKNPNAIKFLVGQVMRLSKGKANPNVAEEVLKKKIL